MQDFSNHLAKILKPYLGDTIINNNLYKTFHTKIVALAIKRKSYDDLEKFRNRFSYLVKALPVLANVAYGILVLTHRNLIGLIVSLSGIGLYFLLLYLESFIPKSEESYESLIKSFDMEKALQVLGSQIVFYESLQQISYSHDDERIEKLSEIINSQLTAALQTKFDIVKEITNPGKPNDNVWRSAVEVKGVPKIIYETLSPLAENITKACTYFFGPANYSVKIYLKTKHKVDGISQEIQMLTSLVKYPYHSTTSNSGGRSWIECKGSCAEAWKCVNGSEDIICLQNEKKKENSDQTYASIAYIKLPKGIGVLTISSSSQETFKDKSVFTDGIKYALMVTPDVFTRQILTLNIGNHETH